MKILVVDDNPYHLKAAKEQLSDHEVFAVQTYDKGLALIRGKLNRSEGCYEGAMLFDVVLIDLLMPASACGVNQRCLSRIGQEMPVGIFLALLATLNGAKYVAIHTDRDHHDHPASACLDAINNDWEQSPRSFAVESAKMLLSNNRQWVGDFLFEDLTKPLSYEEYEAVKKEEKKIIRAKNWKALLEYLLRS